MTGKCNLLNYSEFSWLVIKWRSVGTGYEKKLEREKREKLLMRHVIRTAYVDPHPARIGKSN